MINYSRNGSKVIQVENEKLLNNTNFSGEKYQNGARTCCLRIDDAELAQALSDDNWNVHYVAPRTPDDTGYYYLPLQLSYGAQTVDSNGNVKHADSRVIKVCGTDIFSLTENDVSSLDNDRITSVDIAIRPGWHQKNGQWEIKAWVDYLCAVVSENDSNVSDNNDEFITRMAGKYGIAR